MPNNPQNKLRVAPHIHTWQTTRLNIRICIITLVPVVAWSIFLFGRHAALVWAVSIATALLTDLIGTYAIKKQIGLHESSILTGLLVAAAMPPAISLHIPVIAVIFAVTVVKQLFGGIGSNWMNPAMGGIAFAYLNWPVEMLGAAITETGQLDAIQSATPLVSNFLQADSIAEDVFQTLSAHASSLDQQVTAFFNTWIFNPLNAKLPEGYIDFFMGFQANTLGESGLIFILCGAVTLVALKMIKLEIPLALLLTYAALVKVFGIGPAEASPFSGDILFGFTIGGILFCSFYYATDPVTSPITRLGMLVYGVIIAVLFFVFARWKSYIEGAAFAVIIANVFVSTIDKYFVRLARKFHRYTL